MLENFLFYSRKGQRDGQVEDTEIYRRLSSEKQTGRQTDSQTRQGGPNAIQYWLFHSIKLSTTKEIQSKETSDLCTALLPNSQRNSICRMSARKTCYKSRPKLCSNQCRNHDENHVRNRVRTIKI